MRRSRTDISTQSNAPTSSSHTTTLTAPWFDYRKRGNAYRVLVSRGRRAPCCCHFLVGLNVVWQATELSPVSLPHTPKHWREETRQREGAHDRVWASLSLMSPPSSLFLLLFFSSPHREPSFIFFMSYSIDLVTSPSFVYSCSAFIWSLSIHSSVIFYPILPLSSFLTPECFCRTNISRQRSTIQPQKQGSRLVLFIKKWT